MPSPIKTFLRKAYFSKHLNKWAIRLYSLVHPAPYLRGNMEFEYDVWNGICTFYSQDGRQLGENNTAPEMYREIVETDYKTCTFEGSRYSLPINMTALRNVMAIWDETLQFTILLHRHHIDRLQLRSSRLSLRQGYIFSKIAAAWIAYLARRADTPIKSGCLRPVESAFFTLGVGPFMVFRSLMEKGDLIALDTEPKSADEIYRLADTSGSLVSSTGAGCAGSKKMIIKFLDVAMNGGETKEIGPAAQQAFSRIDDWDRFYEYLYASSRLELLIRLNQSLGASLLLPLRDGARAFSPTERELLKTCLAHCNREIGTEAEEYIKLKNFSEIALSLLEDLQCDDLRKSLAAMNLINFSNADQPKLNEEKTGLNRITANKVRSMTECLYTHCKTDMEKISEALGKKHVPSISIEDMYVRCFGPDIQKLLELLERDIH